MRGLPSLLPPVRMKRNEFFSPPVTAYTSYEDIGKFNMLWIISMVLVPVFIILLGIHVYFKDSNWWTSLASTTVGVINLLMLHQTRTYKLVGIWSVLLGMAIVQASVFLVQDSHVVADTLWCVLVAFFSFFLFGSLIGTIVLITNLSGLLIFLMTATDEALATKGLVQDQINAGMMVNVLYVALALSFIIFRMMKNNAGIIAMYERQTRQNEILLKEVHHRVKNNLQIVSSLLKLQAAESNDEEVLKHFDEAIGRIRSMALIHEKMYNNDDFSAINIQGYILSLVQDITASMQSDCKVELHVDSQIRKMDIKSMVPVSLIFNELITNSLKHGFAGRASGKIEVNIERAGEHVLLYYSDDGEWEEESVSGGFGLELIRILTGQLHGQFERTIDNGTHYRFTLAADQFFFQEE